MMICMAFALSVAAELQGNLTKGAKNEVSLTQLIELVKSNNKDIKIAEFDQKIKEFEHDAAVGYMFGKLDLSETYSKTNQAGYVFGTKLAQRQAEFADFGFDQFLAQMPGLLSPDPAVQQQTSQAILSTQPDKLNYPDPIDNFETKFTYQLPIFTGNKLEGYRSITKKLSKLYGINKEKVTLQKIAEAKKGFYDTLLLEEYVADLETIQNNVEELEKSVEAFVEEGYANKTDLLEVRAKKAEVEEMLIKSMANKELSLAFLSFLADNEIASLDGNFEELNGDKDVQIDEVLKHNKDIQMATLGSKIAQENVSVEKGSYYPTLGGFAEGGWNDKDFGTFDDNSYYLFGVQAKLNIFNGGIDNANYQKAKIGYLKAKEQESLAKSGITLKTKQLLTELKGIKARIKALDAGVALNEEIFLTYKERYTQKLASMNDLLVKESELLESTLKLYEVQNQKNTKLFELNTISGTEATQ